MEGSTPPPRSTAVSTPLLPLLVFGATLLWCLGCWLQRPPERINQFFREGGLVDLLNSTWMIAAAILAWAAWMVAGPSRLRRFWLVAALGLLFLGLDERFQGHELVSRRVDLGEPPLGMRNWSDVLVLLYGLVAFVVVLPVMREIWRERRLRYLSIAAVVFSATTAGIDSLVASSRGKDVVEETFKVLAGAAFFLTAAEGYAVEVRRRVAAPRDPAAPRWGHAAILFALCGLLTWAALGGNDEWQDLMSRYWGDPHSWLVCILLWSSGLVLLLASLRMRGHAGAGHGLWLALAALCGVLGFGEGLRASGIQVLHERVIHQFPATIAAEVGVLHAPVRWTGMLFILLVMAIALLGRFALAARPRVARWYLFAAVLLIITPLADHWMRSEPGIYVAPLMRVAGGACALLGALTLLGHERTP